MKTINCVRAAALAALVASTALGAENALVPANLGDVRLTGWIGKKLDNLIRARVTSDWAKNVMMKECEDAFVNKTDDAGAIGMWQGEFWGKTMLGHARVAEYTRDPALLAFIRESCHRLMKQQEPDGYLGTYRRKDFLKVTDWDAVLKEKGYLCDWNWNIWCRTFTIWGLSEAGRVTGDAEIVTAAARSLEQLIDMLHEKKIALVDTGCNAGLPSCTVIRPSLLLYGQTKNPKFLAFAREIVANWDRDDDVPPNFFRHVDSGVSPYHWYEKTLPHAKNYDWPKVNEMTSCLEGLLAYGLVTDDARARETAVKMYEILWRDERNAVDAVGYNDRFHEAASIPAAITEPCDVIVWMMFCHDLYLATGAAKYADALEMAYLNAFLAGITRDGTWGMRGVRSQGRHSPAGLQSGMTHCHCCVNNLPRGFMDFAESTLARDRSGAYRLAFFTDATASMDGLKVEVDGNWPVGDIASVKVTAAKAARLLVRQPVWSATAKVNGAPASARDGWIELAVNAGEQRFDLAFDLGAKIVRSVKPCDPANVFNTEIIRNRWALTPANNDLLPYLLAFDLPRLRRGPLLLAKSLAAGATEQQIFGWYRLGSQGGGWSCTLAPRENPKVWGAWKASFAPVNPNSGMGRFSVDVSDFPSAGDCRENAPTKSFSIYF